ncbi:MAG TPA: hypothetical protein DHV42_03270 [Lachnospiraceae bacterium]|nr:hypothetical protein [Lachnospiraceae bacterium]
MRKHHSVYLNTVFLLLIFGFTAANILRPQRERSETENRTLTKRPALTWDSLISGTFAKEYESYLSDQFILRDDWITLKTGLERAALKQETNDVYFAADGYLIEAHTGAFTGDTAQQNLVRLGSFFQTLAQTYTPEHLTCMIVPNAVDILRDHLPAFADPYDQEAYLAKVKDVLPDGVWFDASAVLRQAHETDGQKQLYYRTDHHWTTEAAFDVFASWLAAKGIGSTNSDQFAISKVTDSFEGTIASKLGISGRADSIQRWDPLAAYDYYLIYNQSDDLRNTMYQKSFLDTKDKYAYFYGGNYGLIETKMPQAQTGRRLLLIKDSYAHCFAPFTCGYFDEVDLLDPRYYNASIQDLMASKSYTDILLLFNAAGFAEETAIARLLV